MSEPYIYTQKDAWSNCCGADVYDDSDICSDCKEHCGVMTRCPECEDGYREVMDTDNINSRTITPPYKTVICEFCEGEGEIEVGL